MAIEKYWERQGPILFTADGTVDGLVTVPSVNQLKVKQRVKISAVGELDLVLQVKRVVSPTKLYVGPIVSKGTRGNLKAREDISLYTVAKLASITAEEQNKIPIAEKDIIQGVYEWEPTVAIRTLGVDLWGRPWGSNNPLPISGSISIGSSNSQQIQNINSPATADTEFTITLPANTRKYEIKVRNHSAKGRIAFSSGATANNYWTLTRGSIFESGNVEFTSTTDIYMSVNKPNQIIEVVSYFQV